MPRTEPRKPLNDITNGESASSNTYVVTDDMEIDDEQVGGIIALDEDSISLPSAPHSINASFDLDGILDGFADLGIEEEEISKPRGKGKRAIESCESGGELDSDNKKKRGLEVVTKDLEDNQESFSKRRKKFEVEGREEIHAILDRPHILGRNKKFKTSENTQDKPHEKLSEDLIAESLQFALENFDEEMLSRFVANHSRLHFDWTALRSKEGYSLLHFAVVYSSISYVRDMILFFKMAKPEEFIRDFSDYEFCLSVLNHSIFNIDYEVFKLILSEITLLNNNLKLTDFIKDNPLLIVDAVFSECPNMLKIITSICQREDVSFDILTLEVSGEYDLMDYLFNSDDAMLIFEKIHEVFGSKRMFEFRDSGGYSLLHIAVEMEKVELFFKFLEIFKKCEGFDLATHFVDGSNSHNCYSIAKFKKFDSLAHIISKVGGVVPNDLNVSTSSRLEKEMELMMSHFTSFLTRNGSEPAKSFLEDAVKVMVDHVSKSEKSKDKGKERDL